MGSSTLQFLAEAEVCPSERKEEADTIKHIKKEEDVKNDDEHQLLEPTELKEEKIDYQETNDELNNSERTNLIVTPNVEEYFHCDTMNDDDPDENDCEPLQINPEILYPTNSMTVKPKKEAKKRGPKSNNPYKDSNVDPKSNYRPCTECSKIVLKKNYSLHDTY